MLFQQTPAYAAGAPLFFGRKEKGERNFFRGLFDRPLRAGKGNDCKPAACAPVSRGVTHCAPHRGSVYKPYIRAPARHPSNKVFPLDPVGWKQWIFRFKTAFTETTGISGLRGGAPYRWGWARRDRGGSLASLHPFFAQQERMCLRGMSGDLQKQTFSFRKCPCRNYSDSGG